jgi:nitroreductase
MAQAALRAPDHAGLVPFRFKVVTGTAREALGRLYEQVAREAGKDEASVRIDGARARSAPVTVAVIARIDLGHPLVPAHEQWAAVGGAIANFLNAAHALGYAGKMLSGAKARAPLLAAAFCAPGETLVGWIALGTAARPVAARDTKPGAAEVLSMWEPPPA